MNFALLMSLGLIGAFLYLGGMLRKKPRIALFGAVCLDIQFAILGGIFSYAHSYIFATIFDVGSLYILFQLLRPKKK